MRSSSIDISVVVPAKDEAASVPVLASEIENALIPTGLHWECIWVDDGSTDGTLDVLRAVRQGNDAHRWITLDRNHGQSAAYLAGFARATGRVLVTLDADLQNDPADIPRLAEEVLSGRADMVIGIRVNRRDAWTRRISSRVANAFRNRVTGDRVQDVGCSLRVFRRACVGSLPAFHGMHRFLPTLVRSAGFHVVEMKVAHRPRRFGEAKYGIGNRLWVGLLDTLMVAWLQRRRVRPAIRESSDAQGWEELERALTDDRALEETGG